MSSTSQQPIQDDAIRYSRLVRHSFVRALHTAVPTEVESKPTALTRLLHSRAATRNAEIETHSAVHAAMTRARQRAINVGKPTSQQVQSKLQTQSNLHRQLNSQTRSSNHKKTQWHLQTRTWFHKLPADLCERITDFCATDGPAALLNIADSCVPLRNAVFVTLRGTLDMDEQMLGQVVRWNNTFRVGVRVLKIHQRLRRFDATFVLPPLLQLLTAPTLRHATIPAIPVLLDVICRAPKLTSLGVYLRNREDVHALLTHGGNGASLDHIGELELNCVRAENAPIDPFFFENHCAIELLASRLVRCDDDDDDDDDGDDDDDDIDSDDTMNITTLNNNKNLLAQRFPNVHTLHMNCQHRMSCNIWPTLNAFSSVSSIVIDAPADITNLAIRRLRRMAAVELCNAPYGARIAVSIGHPVVKLIAHDRALTFDDVTTLAQCERLRDISVVLDPGAEKAFVSFASRLTTLKLRWGYTDSDLGIARTHGVPHIVYRHVPDPDVLLEITSTATMLHTLHLEFARFSTYTMRSILQSTGSRLMHFVTSVESQFVPPDVQLVAIMRGVVSFCPMLCSLQMHEVSEGTEQRYRLSLPSLRKRALQSSASLLRSRMRLLNLDMVDEAVSRMCGVFSNGWIRSPS